LFGPEKASLKVPDKRVWGTLFAVFNKLVRGTLGLLADATFFLWLVGFAVQSIFLYQTAVSAWKGEDLRALLDTTLPRLALLGTAAMILHMTLSASSKKRSPLWGLFGGFSLGGLFVYRLRARCINCPALVADEMSCPKCGADLTRSVEAVKVKPAKQPK
jgi:hypothetical protein